MSGGTAPDPPAGPDFLPFTFSADGEITGSQSPEYGLVRRPRWVICSMTAAPCACTSSLSLRSHSMVPSLWSCRLLPNDDGLSVPTIDVPIIVSPQPPLAFSTWYRRYRSLASPPSPYAGSWDVLTTRFRSVRCFS